MRSEDRIRGMLATHETLPVIHHDRDDCGYWVGWTIRHKGGIREEIRVASGMPEFVAEWFQAKLAILAANSQHPGHTPDEETDHA